MIETALLDAQEDLYQRLLADEFLAPVAILKRDKGDINAEIENSLGVVNQRGGKIGACIVVLQPLAMPSEPDVAGGVLKIDFTFVVMEDPTLNRRSGGTELAALTIARRIVALMHLYRAGGVMGNLTMQRQVIVPVENGAPSSYEVRFEADEKYFYDTLKVATPAITPREGAAPQSVTLSCATSGASIYYTLDGSHPYAGNPTAVLYTGAPVEVAEAATLRAGAFKTDLIASDVNAADYS